MVSLEIKLRKAVLAATDAKLRADNWQYILDVCDIVKMDPEDMSAAVMELIEKRLGQQDANVILRALSLVVALAENCGSRLKQSVSSKHFTGILYGLVESSAVHITVKKEVAKVVKQLSDSFENDPSLKAMSDMYTKLKRKWPQLLEQQPEKPAKQEVMATGDVSTSKEDKELQEALKLSLLEFEKQKDAPVQETNNASNAAPPPQQQQQQQQSQEQQVSNMKRVRALYDLNTNEVGELSFKKGDIIIVLEQVYRDWWRGSLRGQIGIFPLNYVTPMVEPSVQELEQEQQRENQVFSQLDNVNTLDAKMNKAQREGLACLNQDPVFNDLYGSVTPLRPQITKLIGKYSKEKDDVLALRQVLLNAESTYNELLDRAAKSYTGAHPSLAGQTNLQFTPNHSQQQVPQLQQQVYNVNTYSNTRQFSPSTQTQQQYNPQYHQTQQPIQAFQQTQYNRPSAAYQHPGIDASIDAQYSKPPNY